MSVSFWVIVGALLPICEALRQNDLKQKFTKYQNFNPRILQIAVATLNSEITFYNLKLGVTVGSVEGRNDLWAGRSKDDLISAD